MEEGLEERKERVKECERWEKTNERDEGARRLKKDWRNEVVKQ